MIYDPMALMVLFERIKQLPSGKKMKKIHKRMRKELGSSKK